MERGRIGRASPPTPDTTPLQDTCTTGTCSKPRGSSRTEDGNAIHLVIVPPAGAQPSRAIEVYEPCYACVDAQFSSVPYAARATTDGYDVEFAWPWTPPNGPLVTGDRIGLNLIVGASDTPNSGLELEGLLANNEVGDDTPCGGATHPGCDDRTWCYATLE